MPGSRKEPSFNPNGTYTGIGWFVFPKEAVPAGISSARGCTMKGRTCRQTPLDRHRLVTGT